MSDLSVTLVIQTYIDGHAKILGYLQKLSDGQLQVRPANGMLNIAWHAWHLARWADHLQGAVPGMTPELSKRLPPGAQIWHSEGLAQRWGFDVTELGVLETGMEMPDEAAKKLHFPVKAELLDYVERTFSAANQAVKAIDAEQFDAVEQVQEMTEEIWGEGTIGSVVLEHLTHEFRHLGMMEALLGLQGLSGTATV